MLLVGIVLVSGFALGSAGEIVAYRRGGYTGEFWQLSLDDKLDHVGENRSDWWLLSISQLVGLVLTGAGLAGLTSLIADAGQAPLAFTSFGAFIVVLIAWVLGLLVQSTSIPIAAGQRKETGHTPPWIHSFWAAGYMAENVWVIGANLAYVGIGVAVVQSGLVSAWVGWMTIGVGLVISLTVILTRFVFPEMSLFIPFIIGIVLVVESS